MVRHIRVIDSHTGGEPTRVIVEGGPPLGDGPISARRDRFQQQFDPYRVAVVNEPRGSDVFVGALLGESDNPLCTASVIFFNNVGYLGMCGHGTIGVVMTLAHLGRIQPGVIRLETPVGEVEAEWLGGHRVRIRNVPSYRLAAKVPLSVPGYGTVHGDIAWGGNWFFLVEDHGLAINRQQIPALMDCATKIRQALTDQGISANGEEIDHIELVGPSPDPEVNARNFVLCPGLAYDRSPCGTGTSAKLACLHADGHLAPGETWIQESVIGSRFEGRLVWQGDQLLPEIIGTAYVNADSHLIVADDDPFAWGIRD
ncbi:proline racemase [Chitinivorax tropicus]|uniref:Proline racemase n=1 Tax=Chitinivorax tropicus TaxID=714531 RepID=A0A840MIM8_9PROT|nr:proline racemase family protein [Chitinivorax tropicus]MBB5019064.1 proline racemase [Chitinivorax tropicus]